MTNTRGPRVFQIEVGTLPAHLSEERVRGDMGDGVDAGDVGWGRLQVLVAHGAAGDGDPSLSNPLTRYYAEAGTPPGRWLGSGITALGRGELAPSAQVSEAQLQLLVGMRRDPITGDPLGLAYPAYRTTADRVAARVVQLDSSLGPVERGRVVAQIEAEEATRGSRRAVAGFNFTFSVPKSASVLWAVADVGTQALIAQAHHEAVAEVVAFMEREVAATRTGTTAGDGAVAQVEVTGLIATAFDHFDSRAGDPHLHTHVVISNKVQTVLDGKCRSLDGASDACRGGRVVGAARGRVRRPRDPHLRRGVGATRDGPGPEPVMGDQRCPRRADGRVFREGPAYRGGEGPAGGRVRGRSQSAAIGCHGDPVACASHACDASGEAGPLVGGADRTVAHPRRQASR